MPWNGDPQVPWIESSPSVTPLSTAGHARFGIGRMKTPCTSLFLGWSRVYVDSNREAMAPTRSRHLLLSPFSGGAQPTEWRWVTRGQELTHLASCCPALCHHQWPRPGRCKMWVLLKRFFTLWPTLASALLCLLIGSEQWAPYEVREAPHPACVRQLDVCQVLARPLVSRLPATALQDPTLFWCFTEEADDFEQVSPWPNC